jgi:hypothetical protein
MLNPITHNTKEASMSEGQRHRQIAKLPGILAALCAVPLCLSGAEAKPPAGPPKSVANAPVCDTMSHPRIAKVAPDPVQPGQKVTIKGQNFGTKQCFLGVSFGTMKAANYTYLDDTTLEATVPDLKPGLVPVSILTGGGTSQYVVLIKGK